jgi:hypothetical protein
MHKFTCTYMILQITQHNNNIPHLLYKISSKVPNTSVKFPTYQLLYKIASTVPNIPIK